MDSDVPYKSTEYRFGVRTPDQERDAEAEFEATLKQVPLLKEELDRLEARIKQTDSILYARSYAEQNNISTDEALVALGHVSIILQGEKSIIEGRVRALGKRRR